MASFDGRHVCTSGSDEILFLLFFSGLFVVYAEETTFNDTPCERVMATTSAERGKGKNQIQKNKIYIFRWLIIIVEIMFVWHNCDVRENTRFTNSEFIITKNCSFARLKAFLAFPFPRRVAPRLTSPRLPFYVDDLISVSMRICEELHIILHIKSHRPREHLGRTSNQKIVVGKQRMRCDDDWWANAVNIFRRCLMCLMRTR